MTSCRYAGSVLLKLTYDHDVVSDDDYYVALVNRALKGLLQVVQVGSNIVDVVPVLKYIPGIPNHTSACFELTLYNMALVWFPGAGFKREARVFAQYSKDLRDIPFEEAKKRVVRKRLASCFTEN